MNTSYFEKSSHHPQAVSIAGRAPATFNRREYKKLAPKKWFFKLYKENGDRDFYIEHYQKEVLDKLDPKKVYEELGDNSVLLCWEKPGEFCHRHIVAEWLMKNLGVPVEELH